MFRSAGTHRRAVSPIVEVSDLPRACRQGFDRSRLDVPLTYGGHPDSHRLRCLAWLRGTAEVFHLNDFGQIDRRAFADVSAMSLASEYSHCHHTPATGLRRSGHPTFLLALGWASARLGPHGLEVAMFG